MKFLTYVGKRLQRGNLKPTFLNQQTKEEIWWPKVKAEHFVGAQIGFCYNLTDARFPILWHEHKLDNIPRSKSTETWEAIEKAHIAEDRARKAAKDDSTIEGAVNHIRKFRSALLPQRRAYFDAWVVSEILKGR